MRLATRTGGRPRRGISTSIPGTAARRSNGLTVRPTPPAAHEDQALAPLGELVGELCRHPAAERMAHDRDALDLEHAQEVAHAVGEAGHGVVGPRLLRAPVAEQVRGSNRLIHADLPFWSAGRLVRATVGSGGVFGVFAV